MTTQTEKTNEFHFLLRDNQKDNKECPVFHDHIAESGQSCVEM